MSGRWGRLSPRATLDSADLVTTAIRRGANPALAHLAEPLELLCRDLDGPARLHRDGRRHARGWLLAQLGSRALHIADAATRDAGPSGPDPGLVVVVGSDPDTVARWTRALLATGRVDAPDPTETATLDAALRHLEAERRWHLPSWAEWFERTDHTETLRSLRAAPHAGSEPARPVLLGSWQHGERLDQVIDRQAAVVVDTTAAGASVEAFVDGAVVQRRRWSADVDAESVARYWHWRLALGRNRYLSWRDSAVTPIVEVTADDAAIAVAEQCCGHLRS